MSQFDPHRPQNHAQVDLADAGHNTVEPFYTPGVASTAQSPEMTQYPRSAATTSDGGYGAQDLSRGPSTATSAGFAGRGTFGTMAMPEPHAFGGAGAAAAGGAAAGGALAGMSAKQREAYQERQQNRVGGSQQGYPAAGGSGSGAPSGVSPPMSPTATSTSGPVTVAEDGGAFDDAHAYAGDTVPPT